ncbi:MAG: Na(+)/H(+) antiporter subunit D [Magnetococcales bacterium]|nr:Na(+)/H(+) antiporter subunit D [Magnetococcales bacterium]
MDSVIPPGLFLIICAPILALASQSALRRPLMLIIPLMALGLVWMVPDGPVITASFMGFELIPLRGDALSRLFGTIFTLMGFAGGLFAFKQKSTTELVAALFYMGSAVGVVMAGDLITMFIFWEMMAIGSTLVIRSANTPGAIKASMRYLKIHLLGGVILMAGLAGYLGEGNPVLFEAMSLNSVSTWLILIGFLVNVGAPPFSAWLPDAYPEASFSGSVFLSAFTTKTAVYVLIRGFPGEEVLIYFGLYMVFYGIIYALLENDMRRILAYSIINQVGFMVTGIGIGTQMALNGAASHAFAHIIYKALLLMSAGAVFYRTGKRKCTDLGGLFQSMPVTAICGTIGALAISSFPFTSGFVSKSMIAQAAADQHMAYVWYFLEAASAGVFLHAGIKFPWFVFFQKDSGMRPPDPPVSMQSAMILLATLCIVIGLFPEQLYALLPYQVDYVPYTVTHVVNMLQLLLMAGLAFFVMLPMMKRTLTISLDFDWFYRRLFPALFDLLGRIIYPIYGRVIDLFKNRLDRLISLVERYNGVDGILARTVSTNSAGALGLIVLALCLGIFYQMQ